MVKFLSFSISHGGITTTTITVAEMVEVMANFMAQMLIWKIIPLKIMDLNEHTPKRPPIDAHSHPQKRKTYAHITRVR